jgi:twitching motility protein PilT
MTDAKTALFRRIVLHNKLLAEAELDQILLDEPDPEQALQLLVMGGSLPAKTANQLLQLYHKQLEKLHEEAAAGSKISAAPAIVTTSPISSAAKPSGASATNADDFLAQVMGGADETSAGSLPEFIAPSRKSNGESAAQPSGHAAPRVTRSAAATDGEAAAVQRLLKLARKAKASDLHVKAGQPSIIRVAGRLCEIEGSLLPPDQCERSLLALLNETQRQQFLSTSDLDFCYDGGAELGRFRTNYLRQHRGTDGVFRLIADQVPSLEKLQLPEQVRKFTEFRQGIVLVTGPMGCGKTTTLAAMVDLINRTRAEHIITIEDPIEFVHPCKKGHVNQREVGPHTKSFSNALRAALREAPDVIMVGEMRDLETTSLAITAAETGHLVFATLHTPDAVRTIGRVLDVFPPKEQGQIRSMVSESLRGIISQLLIPSLEGNSMELAVEILVNNTAVGNLIREDKAFQLRGVMQTAKKQGMCLMDDSLVHLAKLRKISKDEALARAVELPTVEKELAAVH